MENITNITNIQSLYDIGNYVATATNGLFWGLMLMALFIIIIINGRRNGIGKSAASASFACLIISIIFLNIGFLQLVWPVFFAIATGGSLFYLRFSEE